MALVVFVLVMDCLHGSVGSQGGTDVGGPFRRGVALEAPRCYLLLQATRWGCRAVVQHCLVTALLGSVTALFGYSKSFNRTSLPS